MRLFLLRTGLVLSAVLPLLVVAPAAARPADGAAVLAEMEALFSQGDAGGLRGLPTAIDIAGARRSLLTLWPVADDGTAEFMVRYYEHLTEGRTWSEALRQTRRDAIAGRLPPASSPLVWGAFVLFEN